jgi:hypothetical protein
VHISAAWACSHGCATRRLQTQSGGGARPRSTRNRARGGQQFGIFRVPCGPYAMATRRLNHGCQPVGSAPLLRRPVRRRHQLALLPPLVRPASNGLRCDPGVTGDLSHALVAWGLNHRRRASRSAASQGGCMVDGWAPRWTGQTERTSLLTLGGVSRVQRFKRGQTGDAVPLLGPDAQGPLGVCPSHAGVLPGAMVLGRDHAWLSWPRFSRTTLLQAI